MPNILCQIMGRAGYGRHPVATFTQFVALCRRDVRVNNASPKENRLWMSVVDECKVVDESRVAEEMSAKE